MSAYIKKKAVVFAFDDVSWDRVSFSCNGTKQSFNEITEFYPVPEIDAAIERLNQALK